MVALSFVTGLTVCTLLLVAVQECTARSLPWVHPCGKPHVLSKRQPAQHKYALAVEPIMTQLRISKGLFAHEEQNIRLVYSKIMDEFTEEYAYEWLPKQFLAWYDEEIHGHYPNLPDRMTRVLSVMHTSLQNFMAAFNEIKHFRVHELSEEMKDARKHVIKNLSEYLKPLLCEVESAMAELRIDIPPTFSVDSIISDETWISDPDHTNALIQEWGVISTYKRFIEHWTQIMAKVNNRKKSKRHN